VSAEGDLAPRAAALAERASEPAISRNVVFGTAGWTDPSLIKSRLFYPRGANSAQARLEHYSRHFSMVEVDASYYTLISRDVSARWLDWTPPSFSFDVKAYPVYTGHPIDVRRLPSDLRVALSIEDEAPARIYPDKLPAEIAREIEARFVAFLEPLQTAGRLGVVLLQFPPWYTATRGNARALEATLERCPFPVAVEFRHKSWVEASRRERVFAVLRNAHAAYVVVDEPHTATVGVPPVVAVTNPELAVVRFHGRNAGGWRKKGASVAERFDYLYAPEELTAWVAPLEKLRSEAKRVHAVFNNCVRNFAIVGAKGLQVLLEEAEGLT
jgi:uncharacterized protein YecE (DUF72 family)